MGKNRTDELYHVRSRYRERQTGRQRGNSYTMGCPLVLGDDPRDLACGLPYVQMDKMV